MAKKIVEPKEPSLFTVDEYKAGFKLNKNVKEAKIQISFCEYVKKAYPDVVFNCDIASGMNLGKHIGGMNARLRSSRAHPDFHAFHPKKTKELGHIYHGFLLELKRSKDEVYKKDGTLKRAIKTNKKTGEKYDHIKEQADLLERLRGIGYFADFGLGLDDCISKFDSYMKCNIY